MISAGLQVLFYALIAAASPLALTATLVVIRSDRPRTNSIVFLTGYLVGTSVACIVGLFVGTTAVARLDSHESVENGLTFLLGVALVTAGLTMRTAPRKPVAEGSSRSAAILAGLAHVKPAAAVSMAALLGFGGPKRLLLTFLAMSAVTGAGLGHTAETTLVLLYIGVGTVLVSVPVGIVVIAGERAADILGRGEAWLAAHALAVRVWLAFGLGAALIVDAIARQLA